MRYVLTYGVLSGLVIILTMIAGIVFGKEAFFSSAVFGYLIMLVALTFIFVGIKRYRDVEQGGVVRFWRAFAVGLGITVVSGLIYVAVWEIYSYQTDYAFIDDYTAHLVRAKEQAGATPEAVAALREEMATLKTNYANPLFRIPMTFLELLPVGLLVALVSAAILRNPKVLPARAPSTGARPGPQSA
jgi:hypothetical protein